MNEERGRAGVRPCFFVWAGLQRDRYMPIGKVDEDQFGQGVEVGLPLAPARAAAFEQAVESRRMVVFDQVAEFMRQDIFDAMCRRADQCGVEV